MSKATIIGAGSVGSTVAYTMALNAIVSEIVIIDINKEKAEGEAMDLSHGAPFVKAQEIRAGDYADTADSNIVIITAGVNQKPGETRLDIVNKNIKVFQSIVPEVVKYSPNCIILVVTNPVDVLTYITYKISGFPANRVLGSGTVLDTSRFRYILSQNFDIDTRNVHSYIIGEHGDSEIAAWSLTSVAGMSADEYCKVVCEGCDHDFKKNIPEEVKNAAYEIINRKGVTNYGIACAVTRIVEAILRDEKTILSVSSLFNGEYDIEDVYLAIPSIVGKNGLERIIQAPLDEEEKKKLQESAEIIKKVIKESNL